MKSVHFSVDLAFEITLKQHTNFCNQSQTDTCRNNQWLSLDFDCRQTSAISTDKTFAVIGQCLRPISQPTLACIETLHFKIMTQLKNIHIFDD